MYKVCLASSSTFNSVSSLISSASYLKNEPTSNLSTKASLPTGLNVLLSQVVLSVTAREDARRTAYTSFMRLKRQSYSHRGSHSVADCREDARYRMERSLVLRRLIVGRCYHRVSPDRQKNFFVPHLFVNPTNGLPRKFLSLLSSIMWRTCTLPFGLRFPALSLSWPRGFFRI